MIAMFHTYYIVPEIFEWQRLRHHRRRHRHHQHVKLLSAIRQLGKPFWWYKHSIANYFARIQHHTEWNELMGKLLMCARETIKTFHRYAFSTCIWIKSWDAKRYQSKCWNSMEKKQQQQQHINLSATLNTFCYCCFFFFWFSSLTSILKKVKCEH